MFFIFSIFWASIPVNRYEIRFGNGPARAYWYIQWNGIATQVMIFVLFVIYLDLTTKFYKNRAPTFLLHIRVFQNFLQSGKKISAEHKFENLGLLPNKKNATVQVWHSQVWNSFPDWLVLVFFMYKHTHVYEIQL